MAARLREAAVDGAYVTAESKKPTGRKRETLTIRETASKGGTSTMRATDETEEGVSPADQQYQIHATAALHKCARTLPSVSPIFPQR